MPAWAQQMMKTGLDVKSSPWAKRRDARNATAAPRI